MPNSTALLIVDVQLGMFESPLIPPVSRADELLATLKKLLIRARETDVPVVYVQHCAGKGDPLEDGTPGCEVHPAIRPHPGEVAIRKRFCDSFLRTDLHELLRSKGISSLVVAGVQTEFCVDTACRRAFSLGYQVTLVEDGHTTWDTKVLSAPQIIAHHNLTLGSSFAKLACSESLFQNAKSKEVHG